MNKKKCQLIFDKLADSIENPVTELKFNDGFELLIAVVLSAQATDIQVNKVTSKLFQVANTPESILNLKEDGLKEFIKSIGLFNSKAKNIV